MEVGGKGLSSSERLLEKQRGHVGGHEGTHTLESVLREGMGRPWEVEGLGTPPPPTTALDEALWGLREPVVRSSRHGSAC